MQELEKILEETERIINMHYEDEGVKAMILRNLRNVRKHMNDGWIPAEERLPEKSGYYRATVRNVETGDITEETAWFSYNVNEPEWRELYGYEVIAWRNLAPYRPGKGEHHA